MKLKQKTHKLWRFYLITTQNAVLPESDAGSDGVESVSGFVIKNRLTLCSYGARCMGPAVKRWSTACCVVPHWQWLVVVLWPMACDVAPHGRFGMILVIGMKERRLDVLRAPFMIYPLCTWDT